ncbi:MucR family transcriptional regulator [Gluconobacter potus]|uniref:MucR family transcriptional regulator n=1 Tax=Gluconobacter potus TaxID=2724927 RepID=UPI0039EC828C
MSSDKDIILGRLNATAQIVTAHLATTKVATEQLPELVRHLYASLAGAIAEPMIAVPKASEASPETPATTEETEQSVAGTEDVTVLPTPTPTPTAGTEDKKPQPAVPIKASVFPDYIVCLEDGKKLKSLKRHLTSTFGMTIEDYKTKWGLPKEYPTVAPNYAELRRNVARKIGLGKRSPSNEGVSEETRTARRPAGKKQSVSARSERKGESEEKSGRKADEHRLANAFSR